MDTISLEVSPRDVLGKKVKALRRTGMIPLHLYGRGMPSQALQGDSTTVAKAVSQVGHHLPLLLQIAPTGGQELVFVREVQRHHITNHPIHVDFLRVDVTQKTTGDIPIVLVGDAPAVRLHSGILNQSLHRLSVECLPMDMPDRIEVDISHLEELDSGVRVSDITVNPGITILSDPEDLVVRVGQPRAEIEAVVEAEREVAEAPTEESAEKRD